MIINEALINLDLHATNKKEAILLLSDMAHQCHRLSNVEDFIAKVNEREAQISTDLGQGIAIPHGKSDAVAKPFIIFAKLHQAILWNEEDQSRVDLVFMIGVPEHSDSNVHLKLISQLAGKLIDEDFVAMLRDSKNKTLVLDYFKTITL